MAAPKRWRTMAREHLEEHLPTLHRELKDSGKLAMWLDRRVNETHQQMETLRSQGMTEAEAWEMARETLMPTPEPEADEPMQDAETLKLAAGAFGMPDEEAPATSG